MIIKEFSEELQQFIFRGSEQVNIEYKQSMNWGNTDAKIVILKAMLAMSNTKDGGVIVVGVNDDGEPKGMNKKDLESYIYDYIAAWFKDKIMPMIDFTINCGKVLKSKEEILFFVIIEVRESKNLPIIYTGKNVQTKSYKKPTSLRKNALYVRSKSPIESREISNYSEWQDFVELLLVRNQDALAEKLPCFGRKATKLTIEDDDKNKFLKQRNDLNS